jgi:uncharacterized protein YjbI with pentapeptide repeats
MLSRWFQSQRKPRVDLTSVDPNFLRKSHRAQDWSGQQFDNFVPVGCAFDSCSFQACNFVRACFGGGMEDTRYVNCTFDRSFIRAKAPGNATFESCSFLNVEVIEFLGHAIEMINCKFTGVIRNTFFNGQILADAAAELGRERNRFEGNDFSGARFLDVSFRTGIDLSKQKLPIGWRNEA